MRVALLFEQSGTFKKEFISRGHIAHDYDIQNKFNETDYKMDLFAYINNTDMRTINTYDFAMAFFPCTWFSNLNAYLYQGKGAQFKKMTPEQIDAWVANRKKEFELAKHTLLTMIDKIKIPLIIENPSSVLIREILGEPYIMHIRNQHGDYFKKPTVYYCFNGANLTPLDMIEPEEKLIIEHTHGIKRSLLAPAYVKNFVDHIEIN